MRMNWKKIGRYVKKYWPYAVATGILVKLGVFYIGKVALTGNKHPFRFNKKEKTEQIENKNEGKLEKTIHYRDFYPKDL